MSGERPGMLIEQFLPSVSLVTRTLPGSYDFTVTAAMISGSRHRVVVDTLIQPADMAPFGGATLVVYTHSDWDHCWGTAAFPGVPVIGHRLTRERLTAPDATAFLQQMQAQNPAGFAASQLVPPDVTFDCGLTLDAGGLTVDLHPLPGHTADSVVVHVPELGLLLAGDAVETPIPSLNEVGRIREWAVALRRWSSAGLKHVVPSHGRPGGPELVTENAAYIDRIVEAAEAGLARGLSLEEIQAGLPLASMLPAAALDQLPDYYPDQHLHNIARVVAELRASAKD